MANSTATLIYFARSQIQQDGPGGVEVLPQEEQEQQRNPNRFGDVWPPLDPDEEDLANDAQDQVQEMAIVRDRALEEEELSQEVDAFLRGLRIDEDRFREVMNEPMSGTIARDGAEDVD